MVVIGRAREHQKHVLAAVALGRLLVRTLPVMEEPSSVELDHIEAALGWRPHGWRRVGGRSAGANVAHWIVSAGARTAFVKVPRAAFVSDWLRREHRNLTALSGASFVPRVLGWFDHGEQPILALEDLSLAAWPPPWAPERITAVLTMLETVAATPVPAHIEPIHRERDEGWARVAADPEPLLSVGMCSSGWLDLALPSLASAAAAAPLAGDALVHLDVRSDNVCFRPGQAILLDWNHASRANPTLDVAFWLPSLHAEGGPPPDVLLPHEPELAAWVAGFFCSYAGLPPIPDAPHVRPLQLAQARTALPWAARALGLPPSS